MSAHTAAIYPMKHSLMVPVQITHTHTHTHTQKANRVRRILDNTFVSEDVDDSHDQCLWSLGAVLHQSQELRGVHSHPFHLQRSTSASAHCCNASTHPCSNSCTLYMFFSVWMGNMWTEVREQIIIIIKGIYVLTIYHARCQHMALYNNTNNIQVHSHTLTCSHSCAHTHTHTHTHRHTHTLWASFTLADRIILCLCSSLAVISLFK